jgi:hypothetical protein
VLEEERSETKKAHRDDGEPFDIVFLQNTTGNPHPLQEKCHHHALFVIWFIISITRK